MKLRSLVAVAIALAVSIAAAQAQVNPGTSPLSILKGGTGGITAAAARINLGFAATANRLYGTDGSGVSSVVTLPAAGLSLSGAAISFSNDLAALEGLSSTGIARRTGTDAWSVGTAVANSELATMAAYTIKANATGSSAVPTDVSIPALTQKASPVAADKVMIADSAASNALKYATVSSLASAGSVSSLNGATGALEFYFEPQGRLTLTSLTPVMVATTTGAATIYYTPYKGRFVPIFDGTNTVPTLVSELSIALGNNWSAATNYDVFIASDSGTIRACTGPAWTAGSGGSATVRGTGAGGTEIERVSTNGLMLNKVQITCRYNNTTTFTVSANRGTYVGTVRMRPADATVDWNLGGSASGGTAGVLGVWNMYNRVIVSATVTDSGTTYTYTTATVRQARASAGNQISFVLGLQEDGVIATYGQRIDTVAASSAFGAFGLGFDTTTAFSVPGALVITPNSTVFPGVQSVPGNWYPGIGLHFVAGVERGDGANANGFNNGGVTNGIGILTLSVRM